MHDTHTKLCIRTISNDGSISTIIIKEIPEGNLVNKKRYGFLFGYILGVFNAEIY